MKRNYILFCLLILLVCFVFSFSFCARSANAQELQQEETYTIHPLVTGFTSNNYFYSCTFSPPGQDGNQSEYTRFSWVKYQDYEHDPLRYWSFSGGRGILINTGLLGLSGKPIIAISIGATDWQDNVGTLSFLGNINLPSWDIVDKTVNTSSSIYAPDFLALNYRSPEQFFDSTIFSFVSDGLRYDLPLPYIVGDAIVIKYDFSIPHYVRFITLYTEESQYQIGYQEGYEQGVSDGYNSGYTQGRNDGYQEGYNAGLSGTLAPNWFTSFVNSVFDILNIEIFPNVRLIYLIFIPVGLGVLALIFKLIRG